jgi:hypothetical protein
LVIFSPAAGRLKLRRNFSVVAAGVKRKGDGNGFFSLSPEGARRPEQRVNFSRAKSRRVSKYGRTLLRVFHAFHG